MNLRQQKGFALAITLALLPPLISAMLIGFACVGFVETDLKLKYQCRQQGISGQQKTGLLLTSLLALNPMAKGLRIQQWIVRAEILAAVIELNFPLAAKLGEQERKIQNQREKIDQKQRQIIREANRMLAENHRRTSTLLRTSSFTQTNVFMRLQVNSVKGKAPTLAVRPDDSDTAPTYSTVDNFETSQALAHQWQYTLSIRPPFSHFIQGPFTFQKSCAVSLEQKGILWSPKIVMGKFSLKSAW